MTWVLLATCVTAGENVILLDPAGNPLDPSQVSRASVTATCGDCHDVADKARSVHFGRNKAELGPETGNCLSCHLPQGKDAFSADGTITRVCTTPSDAACLTCHTNISDHAKSAHKSLNCISCHTGAGHETAARPTCAGCHAGSGTATRPRHAGFTRAHIDRMTCQTCHTSPSEPARHTVLAKAQTMGATGCTACHNASRRLTSGAIRESFLKPITPWAILALTGLCLLHYVVFGPKRVKRVVGEPCVARFSALERVIHLSAALSFLFLATTGICFLLRLEGPFGHWRVLHGRVGAVFAFSVVAITAQWARDARFSRCDRQWLRSLGGYLWIKGNCPAGKFNAGQKIFFWAIAAGMGLIISATGIILTIGRGRAASWVFTLHDFAAITMLLGLTGHIYLSIAANPGALRAIITGRVPESWARRHHPHWPIKRPPAT